MKTDNIVGSFSRDHQLTDENLPGVLVRKVRKMSYKYRSSFISS